LADSKTAVRYDSLATLICGCEVVLETRVLCVERVVVGLGGLNRLRVLATTFLPLFSVILLLADPGLPGLLHPLGCCQSFS